MKGKMELVEGYLLANKNDWYTLSGITKDLDISYKRVKSAVKGLEFRGIVETMYDPGARNGAGLKVKLKN